MPILFTGSYSQNFDTLATTGTTAPWSNDTTLPGWFLFRQPAPGTAITTIAAHAGASTTGSFVSFGATGSGERALGGLGSGGSYFGSPSAGSVAGWIAFSAVNGTGGALSELTLSFDGEQWRNGGNTTAQAMSLQVGFGADFTSVPSWTAAGPLFSWSSPVTGSTGAAVDGNAAGKVAGVGGSLALSQPWEVGATLWLRWVENNDTGNDHGLALDNLTLSASAAPPPALPVVNLSLSTASASEAAQTLVTVTATATAPVSGNQTVVVAFSGTGITGDDVLAPANLTLTIPAGQTTGTLRFNIVDDAVPEPAETLTVALGSPSAGITLGPDASGQLTIANHTGSLLTLKSRAVSANGAEVPAFDASTDRLFVVAGTTVEAYTLAADGQLAPAGALTPTLSLPAGTAAVPNSVAARDGIVAVAYAVVQTATNAQSPGQVAFFDAATGSFLRAVEVGHLPDMITFTPDGRRLLSANEGEPNSYGQASSFDPEGSISLIDLSGGVMAATVQTAGFAAFNPQIDALKAAGVRITGPGATVAQDLEPEYITFTPDGANAVVVLQENNAAAVLDLATATVTAVLPLGVKDHAQAGMGLDASDQDGGVNIRPWPVVGLLQPDAIVGFTVNGQGFYLTANEGDARSYTGFSEEARVGSGSYVLDPTVFPDAASLKQNANLGRLQASMATGDLDADGDIDRIEVFGGRSFTLWDSAGQRVFDSGQLLEQLTADRALAAYNSDGTPANPDSRSDNKGPEPEGAAVGRVGDRTYAFIGLERVGDIVVFDVTTPAAPLFVQYLNLPQDVSPEVLSFVSAADSPTGKPLLITANEISRTVAVFEIAPPVRIADIQGAAHLSPLNGQGVSGVQGIVTAIASNGFYLQDPLPDANPATSEAVFVFTGSNASLLATRTVGEAVQVSGTVSEFRPGGNADNLTVTQIGHSAAVQALAVSPWAGGSGLSVTPTLLGQAGRVLPTTVISDDAAGGNVENPGTRFDPAADGIDFWESLEGMWVQVDRPVAVSPTSSNGEIWVLADDGAGAGVRTARGGIEVSPGDFNPERIQLDGLNAGVLVPAVDVGARLSSFNGVVSFNFENYEVLVAQAPTVVQASPLTREVTALAGGPQQLTVATFNVENLDPGDGAAKFDTIAQRIVGHLLAPDILSLEEVQDNSGPVNNGVVAADATLTRLIESIVAAGGPRYDYRQIDPVNNQDGGEPGGNIRLVFLFNPQRVEFVEGSLQRLVDTQLADGDAFAGSRKPLVGDFRFQGETVTLVGNHFVSKGADDPLFGPTQPPVLASEPQRLQQAAVVRDFVQARLSTDAQAKLIVLGDLNDFGFSAPLTLLESAGLTTLIDTLAAGERHTYNFEGNAQALDHILTSPGLTRRLDGFDVVHLNAEFAVQVSDHDPLVARFVLAPGQLLQGDLARNTLVGGPGDDTLTGLQGRDVLTGGRGDDRFVYTRTTDFGDVITDFEPGADRLVIDALLAAVGYAGRDPVGDGLLATTATPSGVTVLFDPDGTAGPAAPRAMVELMGLPALAAAVLLDPTLHTPI